jgi:NADH-quinone oxidoreductase subunit C
VTTDPSDLPTTDEASGELDGYAAAVADSVGALSWSTNFATVKVVVAPDAWVNSLRTAKTDLGLVFFSFLSAIHWTNDVEVGDPPAETVDERLEVLAAVGDLSDGRLVHFSTSLPVDGTALATLTSVYAGANWHEREAAEMFNIDFVGHPQLEKLYLPSEFEGHPLRKSFPLLSREVKPWPGMVDVEGMPGSTESAEEVDSSDAETLPSGVSTENPGR